MQQGGPGRVLALEADHDAGAARVALDDVGSSPTSRSCPATYSAASRSPGPEPSP